MVRGIQGYRCHTRVEEFLCNGQGDGGELCTAGAPYRQASFLSHGAVAKKEEVVMVYVICTKSQNI